MYIHKIKKETFEGLKYNYPLKLIKDRFGDYRPDFNSMRIEEHKQAALYLDEQKQALKDHLKSFSDFDFSEESQADLLQRRKQVFEKYFNVEGSFMLTITMKGV